MNELISERIVFADFIVEKAKSCGTHYESNIHVTQHLENRQTRTTDHRLGRLGLEMGGRALSGPEGPIPAPHASAYIVQVASTRARTGVRGAVLGV